MTAVVLAPITTRRSFDELSRRGRRARSGSIWVVRAAEEADGAAIRVGYAVGRRVGGAVVRNRVRRRLREVMSSMDRDGVLAEGSYLIGATAEAVDQDFRQLRRDLERAIETVS